MAEDDSWKSTAFRQLVVSKIKEAKQKSELTSDETEVEMENTIFQKARNKEEYLGLLTRLLFKIRQKCASSVHPIKYYACLIPGTDPPLDEDDSWKMTSFRQTMTKKLTNAIDLLEIPSIEIGKEVESQIFQKSRCKYEYVGYMECYISNIIENLESKKPAKSRPTPYERKPGPTGKNTGSNRYRSDARIVEQGP